MRCSEARLKITGSRRDLKNNPELQEHLKACSACAKEAGAAQALKEIFDISSKNDLTNITPLDSRLKFVIAEADNRNTADRRKFKIRSLLSQRPVFGISAVATAVVLILFAVIPFKYEQVVGYEIIFRGVDRDLVEEHTTVCDILFNLGLEEADIDFLGCDTTCNITVQFLKSKDEVEKVISAFSEINDYDLSSHVIPIHANTTRSLLDQVDDKIF
ncbi:MAG: hypothetical protein ABIJ12_00560 [bacterium]